MTEQRFQELLDMFLYVFDIFATDKSEVADAFNISPGSALTRLKRLEEANLICRYALQDMGGGLSIDVSGQPKGKGAKYKELTWQANLTYDDHRPYEAVEHFLEKIQAPTPASLLYAGKLYFERGGQDAPVSPPPPKEDS